MAITQVITALPDAPNPATMTATEFSSAAAASVLAQKAMTPELNTFGTQANALAVAVNADATSAATSETNAASSATAAAVTAGAAAWVAGTYAFNANAISPLDGQTYRNYVSAGVRNTDPKNDPTNWVKLGASTPTLTRSPRTANTILGASDAATLIDITTGTFTQTFDAAATLGSGWFCYLRNAGTGDITLDPNASELIDGLATYVMYSGETRLVQCTGTAFTSVVLSPFYRSFTASGTFTKPPGYSYFGGLIWSGGASGQRTNSATTLSAGGAGGGCGDFHLPASVVGTTETVTIGAGGAAVTAVAVGNVGGNSTFGSLVSAFAGLNWAAGGSVVSGLITGAIHSFGYEGGEGVQNTSGRTIWGGMSPSANASAAGSTAWYGGACGGCLDAAATVRAPGTSRFGGAGGAALSATNGVVGAVPGGGGGATQTGAASGAGGAGELRVWGIA
ncbi:MAG: hypothetical protein WA191_06745 [Telluria sp.]